MRIYYRAENRKDLVKAISDFTGKKAKYLRLPTYAYQIGDYNVDKEGNLNFDDELDSEEVQSLIAYLEKRGFTGEFDGKKSADPTEESDQQGEIPPEKSEAPQGENTRFVVALPDKLVNLANLQNLLQAKGTLIKKALNISQLLVESKDGKVVFSWFDGEEVPKPYSEFIEAICRMSRNQKRISAKVKEVPNEKYAFRCFLLRLGFIGPEFKETRKELLKNLSGSSAFKSAERKEKHEATD